MDGASDMAWNLEGACESVQGIIDKSCTRARLETRHVREETGQMSGSGRLTTRQATRRGLLWRTVNADSGGVMWGVVSWTGVKVWNECARWAFFVYPKCRG